MGCEISAIIHGEERALPMRLGAGAHVDLARGDLPGGLWRVEGPFAVLEERGGGCICAVDAVASTPMFYARGGDTVFFSDDACELALRVGAPVGGAEAEEFLETGFVTGRETLFEGVSAVLPGECVAVGRDGGIRRERYFDLRYGADGPYDEVALVRGLDEAMAGVFSRLAERLGGRPVLVPLSGGCDSRTVAAMLRRCGYPDVLCFSYGRRGNPEGEVSRRVAEGLGYPWEFVEYSGSTWDALIGSEAYGSFLDYACRGKSIACLQPLPAMLELSRRGLVPEGAVVVPGHTLDVMMGSHLPYVAEGESWARERFLRYVEESHYLLGRRGDASGRLQSSAGGLPDRLARADVLREYMAWEWDNRQSRFIANDVRAYEFAGCSYELPFWDPALLRFLSGVPYEGLYGRRLQYAYTSTVVDPLCGLRMGYPPPKPPARWKGIAKGMLPRAYGAWRDAASRRARGSRALADYDWMSADEAEAFEALYGPRFNVNSLVADGTLQRVRAGRTAFGEGGHHVRRS